MSDPFQDAHRHAARKAEKEAAAKEIVARDTRIDDAAKRRAAAQKPEKGYIYSGPFYNR